MSHISAGVNAVRLFNVESFFKRSLAISMAKSTGIDVNNDTTSKEKISSSIFQHQGFSYVNPVYGTQAFQLMVLAKIPHKDLDNSYVGNPIKLTMSLIRDTIFVNLW